MIGTVIILNGATCSGKTTLAHEIQNAADKPFMILQKDDLAKLFPPNHFDSDGFERWPALRRFQRGMHRAIAQFALTGHNVIADLIIVRHQSVADMITIYAQLPVYFVGLHCSLRELERREQERSDRQDGNARRQYEGVHQSKKYDVEVDTELYPPARCARTVLQHIASDRPRALFSMRQLIESGERIGR